MMLQQTRMFNMTNRKVTINSFKYNFSNRKIDALWLNLFMHFTSQNDCHFKNVEISRNELRNLLFTEGKFDYLLK